MSNPIEQQPQSSFEELSKMLSLATREDLIHVIQEIMKVKIGELDILFKTDVNSQELALMPIAWSLYVETYHMKRIEKHLRFIMGLNTSKDGKRVGLVVEALTNKIISTIQNQQVKK